MQIRGLELRQRRYDARVFARIPPGGGQLPFRCAVAREDAGLAAGGIMDGAGVAAVLRLGAVAALLGTAFVACPESSADEGYRAGQGAPLARSLPAAELVRELMAELETAMA